MTPTLDTAAIRKRFEQAIIGIRQDGTMAVLVPLINDRHIDLVRGDRCSPTRLQSHFVSLIRPGDRVEVSDGDGYEIAVYRGFTGGTLFPFSAIACDSDDPDGDTYRYIRPLPAAETETEAETETGQHFNALEYWLTHGLKREQEWDKIRQIFRNALGDSPGCPFCLSYKTEPEPNPLLSRLTAAEHELAAIRAEMEAVQK